MTVNSIQMLLILLAIAPTLSLFSGLAITPVFMLCTIVPLYQTIKAKRWEIYYNTPITHAALALLGWMLLSVTWSIEPIRSLEYTAKLSLAFLGGTSFIYYLYERTPEEKNTILHTFCYGVLIALAVTFIEPLSNGAITTFIRAELMGKKDIVFQMYMLNRGATFLALAAWPVTCYLLTKKKPVPALIVCVLVVIMTAQLASLAATLGIIIGMAAMFWIRLTKAIGQKCLRRGIYFIILAIPFIALTIKPADIAEHVTLPPSAEHRLYIWEFVSHKAEEHPWLGTGIHTSKYLKQHTAQWPESKWEVLPSHPHNMVLQIWLELGWIGVLLYLWLISATIHTLQWRSNTAITMGWLTTGLIIASTAFAAWQMWWVGTIVITAALLIIATDSREGKQKRRPLWKKSNFDIKTIDQQWQKNHRNKKNRQQV